MTKEATKQIHFDPTDLRGMIAIMDEHGNSDSMYPGINENGEIVYISVYHDSIVTRTEQDNGWYRLNTYYRDGSRDETFDGRWR